jgi:squalene-hopene/tetraprenyl-beta-curcumene cyclase
MFKDTHYDVAENNASSSEAIHSKAYNLDNAILQAQEKLLSLQSKEGYWVFELEADCTIPA